MPEAKEIHVTVGQPVQIVLQSMVGSTGYGWYLVSLDGGLALSAAYATPATAGGAGIAPTNHLFDLLAIQEGEFTLTFALLAPWRPAEPADTQTYKVIAKKAAATAADDIEAAMKGREFVPASRVSVGTPMDPTAFGVASQGLGGATQVIYAAPMTQGVQPYPQVIYAAPMLANQGMGQLPQPVYAAPMSAGAIPGMGQLPQPLYAAPMVPGAIPGMGQQPYVIYAAPMFVNQGLGAPQVIYAAPMSSASLDPCLGTDPRSAALRATTLVAYGTPPTTMAVAAADPCLGTDPRSAALRATTLVAYGTPPTTMAVAAVDPCFRTDPAALTMRASTMIAYGAPPTTMAVPAGAFAAGFPQVIYAAPMWSNVAIRPYYSPF
ncbi:MAG: protease inhibitor I42 family protein [Pseudomonadota bacterium]